MLIEVPAHAQSSQSSSLADYVEEIGWDNVITPVLASIPPPLANLPTSAFSFSISSRATVPGDSIRAFSVLGSDPAGIWELDFDE